MNVKYGEYQGVKVEINEHGYWEATIDGADIRTSSYRELKEKIDQTLKNKEKAKRKVLSIKVVNADLKTATVTGVHVRLGTLTMTPKLESRRSEGVWFDCEQTKKLLTEKRAAEARIRQIEKELKRFEIKTEHGYGELRPGEYDRLVADLEKLAASATKAANEVTLYGA
jgi:hypothetical protein